MTPLFGISLGTLIHSEPVTTSLIFGAAMVGFGVYLTAADKMKKKAESFVFCSAKSIAESEI
jgi:drug/metabolite transporter (DMT)-like permease